MCVVCHRNPCPGLFRFTNCRRRSPPSRGPLCSAALILKAVLPGGGRPGGIPSLGLLLRSPPPAWRGDRPTNACFCNRGLRRYLQGGGAMVTTGRPGVHRISINLVPPPRVQPDPLMKCNEPHCSCHQGLAHQGRGGYSPPPLGSSHQFKLPISLNLGMPFPG